MSLRFLYKQLFYYKDTHFQLELNLQRVRRELIVLIDEFEASSCIDCAKLKCNCPEQVSTIRTSTLSNYSTDNVDLIRAPPAETLPLPKWQNRTTAALEDAYSEQRYDDVGAWVRASTPNAESQQPIKQERAFYAFDPIFNQEKDEPCYYAPETTPKTEKTESSYVLFSKNYKPLFCIPAAFSRQQVEQTLNATSDSKVESKSEKFNDTWATQTYDVASSIGEPHSEQCNQSIRSIKRVEEFFKSFNHQNDEINLINQSLIKHYLAPKLAVPIKDGGFNTSMNSSLGTSYF